MRGIILLALLSLVTAVAAENITYDYWNTARWSSKRSPGLDSASSSLSHLHVLYVRRGWTWEELIAFAQSLQTSTGAPVLCGIRAPTTQTRRRTVIPLLCNSSTVQLASLRPHLRSGDHARAVVEVDHKITLSARAAVAQLDPGIQTSAPPNLDRIDNRTRLYDSFYHYKGRGEGQTIYIIDTGIRATHVQFGGRATALANTIDGSGPADCHGHGTHVGGISAGRDYGVAKRALIRAIKCLDCTGTGTVSSVVAALTIVLEECDAAPDSPFSINLSLNGPASQTLDDGVQSILNSCHAAISVAAGNSYGDDACSFSPSRVPGVLTVGSTAGDDSISVFSNVGSCVDLYAPGENVLSAWYTNDTATATLSGTSMATPLVTGVTSIVFGEALPLWVPGGANAGTIVMNAVKAQATNLGFPFLYSYWDATQVLAPAPPPTASPPPPVPRPPPPPNNNALPPGPPPPPPAQAGDAYMPTKTMAIGLLMIILLCL